MVEEKRWNVSNAPSPPHPERGFLSSIHRSHPHHHPLFSNLTVLPVKDSKEIEKDLRSHR